MRSGSRASDGGGWPSAQRPPSNEALGNQGRHASGARSEPQDSSGSERRDAPFGPEISWPSGFRQLDPESREALESAYGTGPVYQLPAIDDFGYGDPGYSDPSYEGPKTPYGNPAFPPGTGNRHRRRDFSGTGRRPSGPGESTPYPERWYDHPQLDDRVLDDSRPARSADPRLAGMTYGELRYEDPEPARTGYDEPLDDEAWFQELQRSAPGYPESPGRPPGPGSGPQRRAEPPGPGFSPQAGQAQAPDRSSGYGQPRRDGSAPPGPKAPPGPQMSARRPRQGPAAPGVGFLSAPVASGPVAAGTASAPVGLLTPPGGARPAAPAPAASPRQATTLAQTLTIATPPSASRPGTGTVRPGHGLDGPEITSSWPAQPATGDLGSFEDFWRDDADEEYSGLFGNREAEFERADAKQAVAKQTAARQTAAKRRTGQRRGGSNDRRLWLGLGGVVVVAAAAIVGIIKYEFPTHSGPAHVMATPATIGAYARTMDLEHEADVAALKQKVIAMSAGQASRVVSAVYESGKASAGNTAQIIMFIGGHLANADPAASVTSFTQQFTGAQVVSAGGQDGKAACVQDGTGVNSVAMCAWFDNDSFGEVVSPTMNASALASAMRTVRPAVERRAAR
jgi:hypothetical protein